MFLKSTFLSVIVASLLLGALASPQPTAAPDPEPCSVDRDCGPKGSGWRCCHGFASNYCTILDPSYAC
ncbi:hypothetical protein CVT24_011847 [Panaeolus cyanescens]|uniref:CBM1 domain-containing protein n=1 Tax=Panaeolus cyanescens TaxID=181874 RepID=A0A409YNW5_9AGAR|nr:hypothetical protein CVT24_011847 [Panaeolus cyanescens]